MNILLRFPLIVVLVPGQYFDLHPETEQVKISKNNKIAKIRVSVEIFNSLPRFCNFLLHFQISPRPTRLSASVRDFSYFYHPFCLDFPIFVLEIFAICSETGSKG